MRVPEAGGGEGGGSGGGEGGGPRCQRRRGVGVGAGGGEGGGGDGGGGGGGADMFLRSLRAAQPCIEIETALEKQRGMTTLKELFALFQLNAATDDITKAAPETWDHEMDKMRVTEQLQAQLQAQAKQPWAVADLQGTTEAERDEFVGEKLYALVQLVVPEKAGTVTAMLQELDDSQLRYTIPFRLLGAPAVPDVGSIIKAHTST